MEMEQDRWVAAAEAADRDRAEAEWVGRLLPGPAEAVFVPNVVK